MSKWPPAYPAPLSKQFAMASAGVAGQVHPDDSASSCSRMSWSVVQGAAPAQNPSSGSAFAS